jgi:hypothetical protein
MSTTMNCTDFRQTLMHATGPLDELGELGELAVQHAAQCPQCQALLQAERALRQRLRELPPLRPAPGLEQRLARAYAARRQPRRLPGLAYALAASVLAAVLIPTLWLGSPTAPAPADVPAVASAEMQTIRLAFKAPRDLQGVQMRIELPPGVTLASHPGRQTVEWTTDLAQGSNLLELAVIGTSAEPLVATLHYRNSQRRFVAALPSRSGTAG